MYSSWTLLLLSPRYTRVIVVGRLPSDTPAEQLVKTKTVPCMPPLGCLATVFL